ncbi:MAG: DUF1732 domain-containing protein [Rhodopseudomonas palustris]|nr:DUF1732 domain-containing protein [Rhodopseudomonas palustris]
MTRLTSHIEAFRRATEQEGTGKKLDFIVQEIGENSTPSHRRRVTTRSRGFRSMPAPNSKKSASKCRISNEEPMRPDWREIKEWGTVTTYFLFREFHDFYRDDKSITTALPFLS